MKRATFILLLTAVSVRADVVVTSGRSYYGRVVSVTRTTISFLGACDPARHGEIDREDVKSIVIDRSLCEPKPTPLPHAGMQAPCDQARTSAYEIGFTGGGAVLAYNYVIGNGRLHADLGVHGSIHGPLVEVRYVLRRDVCPKVFDAQEPSLPRSFCLEPMQIAVNFSLTPVFSNDIFTRGFAVYVQSDDNPQPQVAKERREVVAKAFGTAVLFWTAALQDARKDLPPDVARYVDSIISRSAKYQLLSPPQAVPSVCPETASIHVRWLTGDKTIFPTRFDYVGKAQVEGRTIALDARDFQFAWSLRSEDIPPKQINLVKVLAHEFGHSLGLPHAAAGKRSIMADVITELPDMPTHDDAMALVAVLRQQIHGSAAGEFNATFCSGLRAGH